MDDQIYNNEDRINRYLRGEMTPEEETVFESDLQKDNTLKRQAESMARIIKGMETLGDEHDKYLVEQMKASSEKKVTPVRWISIAASFALILIVGYHIYDYSATTSLGREYASAFSTSSIIRGEEDKDVSETLAALFDNVANGEDLDNAIEQLEKLWALSQSDTYNGYTTYELYIGWNLAIAHLRNNDKKEAKIVLGAIKDRCPDNDAVGSIAKEVLNKL